MEQVKPEKIGSTRLIQNPHKAFELAEGKYEDRVEQLDDAQRLPMLERAPDPQPFGSRR